MADPSKIIENEIEYSIGNFTGFEMIYDFDKILIYLDVKGKSLFGVDFKIHKGDEEVILKLCNYIVKDVKSCQKHDIDTEKNILLSGPVGCGKTSIFKLIQCIVPRQRAIEIIPCRNIVFGFNHLGYKIIEDYENGGNICFDDLGIEPYGSHYGRDCNVMGEILISRYELFLKSSFKTHATTNLDSKELEERYGNRVISRMREMFNLVSFNSETLDKRK
ncbi:P-loop NTPase family protein [Gelidibacter pelagius]|uniref:ATPase n=1 Tax=Gelidibacter pelagius TaxID=2819985 RepID=A0ABS3SQ78_9FLAO|nr:ATPase [Gelidibacter pelagius]MBO3097862.1 ATPase [Gelidibacter pelagius]